jgi:hypothetical protein
MALKYAGFEVLMAVTVRSCILWDMMQCSLVEIFQRFGAICCLHLQDWRITLASKPSLWSPMIEALHSSEMSVNFYQSTRRHNPEDSGVHTNNVSYVFFKLLRKRISLFWVVMPCSPLKSTEILALLDAFFMQICVAYTLTQKMEADMFVWNVTWLSAYYMALYPRI